MNRLGSLFCLGLGSLVLASCASVRYVDYGATFHVGGDEAARIDELDANAPAPRSSKSRVAPKVAGKLTLANCDYWRTIRAAGAHESKTVAKYVEARTRASCLDFPNVFEDTSLADLGKIVARRTRGMQREGALWQGSLDPFESHRFELERGKCYSAVLRLVSGFEPYEEAKKFVRFAAVADGVQIFDSDSAGTELASDHLHGQGSVIEIGCPIRPGGVLIVGDPKQVAVGRYSLELMSKPISEADLATQADAVSHAQADAAIEAKRHLRQVCADCLDMYNYCVAHPSTATFDCKASQIECVETTASAELTDCK